jgi:hypothetical protein
MQVNQKLLNLPVCFNSDDFCIEKFSFSAILGFTGLINQVQFHAALTGKDAPAHAGGWNGMMNV